MATLATPSLRTLDFSLEFDDFKALLQDLVDEAIPSTNAQLGIRPDFRYDPDAKLTLKALPEMLAALGNPVSCPFCAVPLAKGPSARLCLACGKALGPLPAGLAGRYFGSLAEKRAFRALVPQEAEGARSARSASSASVPEGRSARKGAGDGEAAIPDDFSNPEATPTAVSKAGADGGGAPLIAGQSSKGSPANHLHMFASQAARDSPSSEPPGSSKDATDLLGQGDFFSQLSCLDSLSDLPVASGGAAQKLPAGATTGRGMPDGGEELSPEVEELLRGLPDLSYMLADRLVVPARDPEGPLFRPAGSVREPAASISGEEATLATMSEEQLPPANKAEVLVEDPEAEVHREDREEREKQAEGIADVWAEGDREPQAGAEVGVGEEAPAAVGLETRQEDEEVEEKEEEEDDEDDWGEFTS
eukprot:TRINITY_DN220_c0_g4_i1.p1 TRINITY_DN220_c0_g4~~TRINITY_DN220_c0_g4_i1.p1  ORF type:complete len:419 (+),score=99.74 TRINITY_DN220_c0_g4_i1:515-1771(+)